MSKILRNIVSEDSLSINTLNIPMQGNQNLVDYKALLRRSGKHKDIAHLEEKVGVIASTSRAGQTAQGLASFGVPGDLSDITHPVRSQTWGAATTVPGGLPRARRAIKYRCPEGFRYGGRFTDSQYTTCGQRLFDTFTLGTPISKQSRSVGQRTQAKAATPTTQPTTQPAQSPQTATPLGQSEEMTRALQIPRVTGTVAQKRKDSISQAIKDLTGAADGESVLIRRDGYALKPVVTAGELRLVPENRNMEDAAYLMSVTQAASIGAEELGLLSNTGVTTLIYVLPNGVTLRLDRSRPLTTGERRKLGRTVNQVSSIDVSTDPTARLKAVVENSDGGIKYLEDLSKVSKPTELVDNADGKKVPKWVAESFGKAKRRSANDNS
jgi:hypothetical protein